jgi:hypothetical protein
MECKSQDCTGRAVDGSYCVLHSCKECDNGYSAGKAYCEKCQCSHRACYRYSRDAKQRCVAHREIKPLLCTASNCTKPILDSRGYCEDHTCHFYSCKVQKEKWAGSCAMHRCTKGNCYRKPMYEGGLCTKHVQEIDIERWGYKKRPESSNNSNTHPGSTPVVRKCKSPGCDHELISIVDYCPIHSCNVPRCLNYATSQNEYLCTWHKCSTDSCKASRALPSLYCERHATEATHLVEATLLTTEGNHNNNNKQSTIQRITSNKVTSMDGKRKFQSEDYDVCQICKCIGIDTEVEGCCHEFHRECILKWMTRNKRCPVCNCTIPVLSPVVYSVSQQ